MAADGRPGRPCGGVRAGGTSGVPPHRGELASWLTAFPMVRRRRGPPGERLRSADPAGPRHADNFVFTAALGAPRLQVIGSCGAAGTTAAKFDSVIAGFPGCRTR